MKNHLPDPSSAAPRGGSRRAWTLAALITAATTPSLYAVDTAPLQFKRELQPPVERATGLSVATLDAPVLAATDDAYANLRLVRGDGQETPFRVRTQHGMRTREHEYTLAPMQQQVQVLPDNRLEIVLHLSNASERVVALLIDTPLDDFEKQVSVWAGDGTTWEPLVAASPIFDYSRFIEARHVRVELPPASHARLRVVIDAISAAAQSPFTQIEQERRDGTTVGEVERSAFQRQDFRIDRLRLVGRTTTEEREAALTVPYPLTAFTVTQDAERRSTDVFVDAGRAPLTALDLQTPAPFFHRSVTLEARNRDAQPWQHVASGTISRLQGAAGLLENLRVTLPRAARYQHYRLRIANLDSPPLAITGLSARGEIHELIFFSEADARYTLFYGGEQVPAPRYDVDSALGSAPADVALRFTLDAPTPNPAYTGNSAAWGWWNHRGLLVVAVVLMVAALGWVLARAARQLPPPAA